VNFMENSVFMKRKLIFDPEFKPIRYTGDREREFFPNGIFLFDITALDEHIRSHQDKFVVTDVEVDRYYTDDRVMGVKELKEEHIEAADLNRPIIFVEIAPDRWEKLTGSNRVQRICRLLEREIERFLSCMLDNNAEYP